MDIYILNMENLFLSFALLRVGILEKCKSLLFPVQNGDFSQSGDIKIVFYAYDMESVLW